jgi:hypothetical protein
MVSIPKASTDVWAGRAQALADSVGPILTWARQEQSIQVDEATLRSALSMDALDNVLRERKLPLAAADGRIRLVDLADAPETMLSPLAGYLHDTAAYDPGRGKGVPQAEATYRQHSYVLSSLAPHIPMLLA